MTGCRETVATITRTEGFQPVKSPSGARAGGVLLSGWYRPFRDASQADVRSGVARLLARAQLPSAHRPWKHAPVKQALRCNVSRRMRRVMSGTHSSELHEFMVQ